MIDFRVDSGKSVTISNNLCRITMILLGIVWLRFSILGSLLYVRVFGYLKTLPLEICVCTVN